MNPLTKKQIDAHHFKPLKITLSTAATNWQVNMRQVMFSVTYRISRNLDFLKWSQSRLLRLVRFLKPNFFIVYVILDGPLHVSSSAKCLAIITFDI